MGELIQFRPKANSAIVEAHDYRVVGVVPAGARIISPGAVIPPGAQVISSNGISIYYVVDRGADETQLAMDDDNAPNDPTPDPFEEDNRA